MVELLKADIAALLEKAESADTAPAEKETLPYELVAPEKPVQSSMDAGWGRKRAG